MCNIDSVCEINGSGLIPGKIKERWNAAKIMSGTLQENLDYLAKNKTLLEIKLEKIGDAYELKKKKGFGMQDFIEGIEGAYEGK